MPSGRLPTELPTIFATSQEVDAKSVPLVASAAARDILFPIPTADQRVQLKDTKKIQRYDQPTLTWVDAIAGGGELIPAFANEAARDAAFPTPTVNQKVLLLNRSSVQLWDGLVWNDVVTSGIKQYNNAVERDVDNPTPVLDQLIQRKDTGAIERWNGLGWTVQFDRSEIINVKSRGAGTGIAAVDTPIILAALAEALANPLRPKALYFPQVATNYAYDATIAGKRGLALRGVKGFVCYGDGSFATQIWYTGGGGADTCMWRLEDVTQSVWSNLFIRCNGAVESVFLSYNNGGRSGITPTGNQFHNVFVDGVSGSNADYCWSMIYMPWTPNFDAGSISIASGGAATFTGDVTNEIANGGEIRIPGTGTVTISGGGGAALFSTSQAGRIVNGTQIQLAGVNYTVSGFNGTTGATLAGAPNQAGSTFYHKFVLVGRGNGRVSININTLTFTHSQTGFVSAGSALSIEGVGPRNVLSVGGGGLTAVVDGSAVVDVDKTFSVTAGGTNATHFGVLLPALAGVTHPVTAEYEHKSPIDQNNDLNTWFNCWASLYKIAGWLIGHSQAKIHTLYRCEFQGGGTAPAGVAKYGVKVINGSIRWHAGNGGGNRDGETRTAGADFRFEQPMDNQIIDGGDFEGSCRLIETSHGFGPAYNIELRGPRFAGDHLHVDGFMVDYDWAGGLTLAGGFYGNGSNPVTRIRLRGGCTLRCHGASFDSFNSDTTEIFQFDAAGDAYDVDIGQNTYVNSTGGQTLGAVIPPGSTAPFVHYGSKYRTNNSGAVVGLRNFRDTFPNQIFDLAIEDDFSFVQSGGRIHMQGSADWGSPTAPIRRGSRTRFMYVHSLGVNEEIGPRYVYAFPADITTLIAAIDAAYIAAGGVAGNVFGIFDRRYNVDASAGRVVGWGDARGPRYGPTLRPTGTSIGPVWDAVNRLLVFGGGVNTSLRYGTVSNPLFNAGSLSVVLGLQDIVFGEMGGWGSLSAARVGVELNVGATDINAQTRLGAITSGPLAHSGATKTMYGGRRAQTGGNIVLGVSKNNGNAVAGDGGEVASGATADGTFDVEAITYGGRSGDTNPDPISTKGVYGIYLKADLIPTVEAAIRTWSVAQHGTP